MRILLAATIAFGCAAEGPVGDDDRADLGPEVTCEGCALLAQDRDLSALIERSGDPRFGEPVDFTPMDRGGLSSLTLREDGNAAQQVLLPKLRSDEASLQLLTHRSPELSSSEALDVACAVFAKARRGTCYTLERDGASFLVPAGSRLAGADQWLFTTRANLEAGRATQTRRYELGVSTLAHRDRMRAAGAEVIAEGWDLRWLVAAADHGTLGADREAEEVNGGLAYRAHDSAEIEPASFSITDGPAYLAYALAPLDRFEHVLVGAYRGDSSEQPVVGCLVGADGIGTCWKARSGSLHLAIPRTDTAAFALAHTWVVTTLTNWDARSTGRSAEPDDVELHISASYFDAGAR